MILYIDTEHNASGVGMPGDVVEHLLKNEIQLPPLIGREALVESAARLFARPRTTEVWPATRTPFSSPQGLTMRQTASSAPSCLNSIDGGQDDVARLRYV
jgi:hypothetical protein